MKKGTPRMERRRGMDSEEALDDIQPMLRDVVRRECRPAPAFEL